jgi:putative transposase
MSRFCRNSTSNPSTIPPWEERQEGKIPAWVSETRGLDGAGRAIDNIFTERLWRTVKQDYVYLYPAIDERELFHGLNTFFDYYNHRKTHQGIDRKTPGSLFLHAA